MNNVVTTAAFGPELKRIEVRDAVGGITPDFDIVGVQRLESLLSQIIVGAWKNDTNQDFNTAIQMKSIMQDLNPFIK